MKPFGILELDIATSTPKEVKAKYKNLLKVHHPDHGGSTDKFIELNKAYKEALQIAQDTKCPNCHDGKDFTVRGFTVIALKCRVCNGTGKKYK